MTTKVVILTSDCVLQFLKDDLDSTRGKPFVGDPPTLSSLKALKDKGITLWVMRVMSVDPQATVRGYTEPLKNDLIAQNILLPAHYFTTSPERISIRITNDVIKTTPDLDPSEILLCDCDLTRLQRTGSLQNRFISSTEELRVTLDSLPSILSAPQENFNGTNDIYSEEITSLLDPSYLVPVNKSNSFWKNFSYFLLSFIVGGLVFGGVGALLCVLYPAVFSWSLTLLISAPSGAVFVSSLTCLIRCCCSNDTPLIHDIALPARQSYPAQNGVRRTSVTSSFSRDEDAAPGINKVLNTFHLEEDDETGDESGYTSDNIFSRDEEGNPVQDPRIISAL